MKEGVVRFCYSVYGLLNKLYLKKEKLNKLRDRNFTMDIHLSTRRSNSYIFCNSVIHNIKHQWSSGRIVPCHGTDPGSIPGWCNLSCDENYS